MSVFIKYEDCAVKINDSGIFASEATFSMSADTQVERLVDGSILLDADGTQRHGANGPLKGQLSLNYYMDDNFSNFFDLLSIGELEVTGTFAGVEIRGMYLTNTSFSAEPFAPIPMSVTFDVYGPISAHLAPYADTFSATQDETTLLNGATSVVSGVGVDSKIDYITNFDYSVSATRTPSFLIGESAPSRVTIDNIEINMNINGEKFGDNLKINGNTAELTVTMKDLYDNVSKQFGCTGKIINQELQVSSEDYLKGGISVKQIYK